MGLPDIRRLHGVVSDDVLGALGVAHEAYNLARIPHALVGGLAVGAYGCPRKSKDIDFLVGPEAFTNGPFCGVNSNVLLLHNGVPIDPIPIYPGMEHLQLTLNNPEESEGIPVASLEAIVCMKLSGLPVERPPRQVDDDDIVALLHAGFSEGSMLDYLDKNAPHLIVRFEKLVKRSSKGQA